MVLFIRIIVAVLVFFTPFSFAATEPWAFSILQGLLALAWFCMLISRREIVFSSLSKWVLWVFSVLIGISLLQSICWRTLLQGAVWYPATLMPLYTWEHISLFITYGAIVVLIMQVYQSLREIKQLLGVLALGAAAVGICAMVCPQGEYVKLFAGPQYYLGGIGPFINRNHAGVFFVMNGLLFLGLFFTSQLEDKRGMSREQYRSFIIRQCCMALVTLLMMIGSVYTRSRGAMLGLWVGLFSYAFLCFWAIPQKSKKKLKAFFYTTTLLCVSAIGIYTYIPEINEFAHRSPNATEEVRRMLYRSAGHILSDYPLWGIGTGALPIVMPSYMEWRIPYYVEHLHNDWLEILVGIGYGGMLLLLTGLVGFVGAALERLKHLETTKQVLFASLLCTLLAMGVSSTVDFHFFVPGCALIFFIVLGMIIAPTFHKGHVHGLAIGWVTRIVGLAILVGALWIPFQKTRCWRSFEFGKGLKIDGKLQAYRQGLSYYPSPRYAVRLANAYYNAGIRSKDPLEKEYYWALAQEVTQSYLEKYPKDKELSKLYMRVRNVAPWHGAL